MKMDRRINIYTPAGYEQSGDRKYPVLYLLHGMGGDEDEWTTFGRAHSYRGSAAAHFQV